MIDLVYLYSAGSDTNEIRYSLRSFQKHVSGLGKLFIVGDDPGIFKDFTHIPMDNIHGVNLARNIYEKILAACDHKELSNPFMCSSDDYILLHDYVAAELPFYYKGDFKQVLQLMSHTNYYKAYVEVTNDALIEKQLPTKWFNVHFPILYDKYLFPVVMQQFDWEKRKSFISKSLYANSLGIEGEPIDKDHKFFHAKTKTALIRQMRGLKFFSTDTSAINEPMLEVLGELFPDRHPCEL